MTGHVIWIVAQKGYCFLKSDEDSREFFAHLSAFPSKEVFEALSIGTPVSFQLVTSKDGRQKATGVTV